MGLYNVGPKKMARIIARKERGKTYAEIARLEGLTTPAVKSLWSDYRRELRRQRAEAHAQPRDPEIKVEGRIKEPVWSWGPLRTHDRHKGVDYFPDRTKQPGYWERVERERQQYRQEAFDVLSQE